MSHLDSVKSKLKAGEALIVTSTVNQRWLTGFDYTDGFVVVTPGKSYLITDFRYIEAAKAIADPGFEIVMYERSMFDEIRRAFSENSATKVYVEDATLPVADLDRFKKTFEDIEFISGGSSVIDGLREFKDADEIEKMKRAQKLTDDAFDHILGFISPDKTEIDVALELEFYMRSHGAEKEAFQTIAVSGRASSMPHGVPRPVKLEKGFLTMDFGAMFEGYCSDMTRTIVIGKADDEMKKLYNTVLEAQTAALDALYAGERGRKKLDTIARDIIDNAGYRGCFGHSLGHGVGMYIHEAPGLSQRAPENAELSVGDVITIEPGIYIEGKYGCRIEDMAVVTASGIYDFTHSPKHLIEL